jgi:hypothetical protein
MMNTAVVSSVKYGRAYTAAFTFPVASAVASTPLPPVWSKYSLRFIFASSKTCSCALIYTSLHISRHGSLLVRDKYRVNLMADIIVGFDIDLDNLSLVHLYAV